jgi:hypothetical protein
METADRGVCGDCRDRRWRCPFLGSFKGAKYQALESSVTETEIAFPRRHQRPARYRRKPADAVGRTAATGRRRAPRTGGRSY